MKKPKLILIIDDLGDNFHLGKRVLNLPVALNLAFLPNTPFAKRLAEQAFLKGHDVMLHFPMEATTRPDLLGKGALVKRHNEQEAQKLFDENLRQIPFVIGFNNHMGSVMTGSKAHMDWIMSHAAKHGLYFVDSKTAANSVALQSAELAGIPSLDRDVFLDPSKEQHVIEEQWRRALQIADAQGEVVVIGHPYRETLKLLERELPNIAERYQLVTVSDYWKEKLIPEIKLPVPAIGDGDNLSVSKESTHRATLAL
ncbi:divergent polysaccharide deacetylase family protein [Pleionea sediminis]|uniref:divergent polysaccharide deacetylase family protein n=1 Tax=Pleionea sediminis TaxID=2569479 RepID=UPI0013DE066D|nr:divergent polysaccharide deacetylase family protein [Pleionea sediminis]